MTISIAPVTLFAIINHHLKNKFHANPFFQGWGGGLRARSKGLKQYYGRGDLDFLTFRCYRRPRKVDAARTKHPKPVDTTDSGPLAQALKQRVRMKISYDPACGFGGRDSISR
jgi:hypothetical protein